MATRISTVVEHLTHNSMIKVLNAAIGTGREPLVPGESKWWVKDCFTGCCTITHFLYYYGFTSKWLTVTNTQAYCDIKLITAIKKF